MKITKKTVKWAAAALLLTVPTTAYAMSLFPVRVTVGHQPTNYRALVIDGTTYVALRDVATLTGREVAYNSGTRTVNISDGGNSGNSVSYGGNAPSRGNSNVPPSVGMGGTTQRSGTEGRVGQLLVTPQAGLRVDRIERKEDDADAVYLTGIIRNTSRREQTYSLKDATLVTQSGDTVKNYLTASEMGGEVYVALQPGEQSRISIRFRTQDDQASRVVVTIGVNSGNPLVFRATF